jgi:hypothetical protein
MPANSRGICPVAGLVAAVGIPGPELATAAGGTFVLD